MAVIEYITSYIGQESSSIATINRVRASSVQQSLVDFSYLFRFKTETILLGDEAWIPDTYLGTADDRILGVTHIYDFYLASYASTQITSTNTLLSFGGDLSVDISHNTSTDTTLTREGQVLLGDIQQYTDAIGGMAFEVEELQALAAQTSVSDGYLIIIGDFFYSNISQETFASGRIFTGNQLASDNVIQQNYVSAFLEAHEVFVRGDVIHNTNVEALLDGSTIVIHPIIASQASETIAPLSVEKLGMFVDALYMTNASGTIYHFVVLDSFASNLSSAKGVIVFAKDLLGSITHNTSGSGVMNAFTNFTIDAYQQTESVAYLKFLAQNRSEVVHNTIAEALIHLFAGLRTDSVHTSNIDYSYVTRFGYVFLDLYKMQLSSVVARLSIHDVTRVLVESILYQITQQESRIHDALSDISASALHQTGTEAYLWMGYHRLIGNQVQYSRTLSHLIEELKPIILKPRLVYYGEPNLKLIIFEE